MIKETLVKHNIRLKKRLGQNFLSDINQLNKIADAADLSREDLVLEIGTGLGTLTKIIAARAGQVITVEYDRSLIPAAKDALKGFDNIELVNDDIMEMNIPKVIDKFSVFKHRKVVANVPYYITTPLISLLLGSKADFETIVLLIQKEVAERIIAKPGTKAYGSFTIFVNYYAEPKITHRIPASSFIPRPKVDSAVLKLIKRKAPTVKVKDEKLFFKIVHAAFQQRRKMLKNAIENAGLKWPDNTAIDGKRRGETLSIQEFAELSSCF